jgi:hypothetical protein
LRAADRGRAGQAASGQANVDLHRLVGRTVPQFANIPAALPVLCGPLFTTWEMRVTSLSDAAKIAYTSFWQAAKDFGLGRFYAYLGCYLIILIAALLRIEYIIQYNPMHENLE